MKNLGQINILMSVYNGEQFLPEQLESLAAQRNCPDWTLLWRDDGSSDRSVEILSDFKGARRVIDDQTRLGPAISFLRLLEAANDDADAFAFCDQDDVWLPDKLSRAWQWLSSQPLDRPALYFGRQHLVDPRLRPISLSPAFRRPPGFCNALAQNIAAGCTVMMNAAARKLIVAAPPPPQGSMHDWWTYILVSGAGGAMRADNRPVILYRQHKNNAVGANASLIRRTISAFKRGPEQFVAIFQAHLDALNLIHPLLSPEARESLSLLQSLRELPRLTRIQRLSASGLYRQHFVEDLFLRGMFLMVGSAKTYPNAETTKGWEVPK